MVKVAGENLAAVDISAKRLNRCAYQEPHSSPGYGSTGDVDSILHILDYTFQCIVQ